MFEFTKKRFIKFPTNDCSTNYGHTVSLVVFTVGLKTGSEKKQSDLKDVFVVG